MVNITINKVFHRLFKLFGQTYFYENKFGIKAFNKNFFRVVSEININQENINPQNIFLGFDGLKDKYTLLGVNIVDSPHYKMMLCLTKNEVINQCDYVIRERSGYLDGRSKQKVNVQTLNEHQIMYEHAKESILSDQYEYPIVYKVANKIYVLDGKHRVALACLLEINIKCICIDIETLNRDIYNIGLYYKMLKNRKQYSINLEFMSYFMEKEQKGKQILAINRNHTDNLGDQAIGKSVYKLFRDLGAHVDLAEYCNWSGKTTIDTNPNIEKKIQSSGIISRLLNATIFTSEIKWKLLNQNLFQPLTIKKYDIVLIGGGELIQSNQIFPVALNLWIKKIKKHQPKTKIILFAVGVTGKYTDRDYILIKNALKYVDEIYVRDNLSADNLKKIFNKNSTIIPDAVFINSFISNKIISKNTILYGITTYDRIKRYNIMEKSEIEYFENVYKEIEKLKIQYTAPCIKLFFMTQSDYNACKKFNMFLKHKYNTKIEIEDTSTLNKLVEAFMGAVAVYSPRMHALILGSLCGGEIHPRRISPKIITFEKVYLPIIPFENLRKNLEEIAKRIVETN